MMGKWVLYRMLFIAAAVMVWSTVAIAGSHQGKEVQIDQIEPAQFGPGFEIRIVGRGFRTKDVVKVGRLALDDATITDTEIQGVVPKKATKAARIAVFRSGVQMASFRDFTFAPAPRVLAVHPAYGEPGGKVVVSGEALGTVTEVKIGNQAIVPDSVGENRVTFTVPEGTRTGMIAVISPVATVYSQREFEVFYPPTLTGVDKPGAYPGETVILNGTHLGSDKVHFKLGKFHLKVLSRHRTSVTVVLPKGARSGRFSVSCRGNTHVLKSDFTVYGRKASGS